MKAENGAGLSSAGLFKRKEISMTDRIQKLFLKMIDFDADADLIQHFTKVHSYCRLIASLEGVDEHTAEVLEAAALVHDIGIPVCNQKYGSHPGNLQEKEGPPLARQMLSGLNFTKEETDRVCTLVGEHHTYLPMDGIDHQILVEADFIVNSFENGLSRSACQNIYKNIFKTEAGKRIFATMFGMKSNILL